MNRLSRRERRLSRQLGLKRDLEAKALLDKIAADPSAERTNPFDVELKSLAKNALIGFALASFIKLACPQINDLTKAIMGGKEP